MKLSETITDIVLYFLLAVTCIGGMELAFCRYNDPELFYEIVSPASQNSSSEEVLENDDTQSEPISLSAKINQFGSSITGNEVSQDDREVKDKADVEPEERTLVGGNHTIVYYNQTDPAWKDKLFGVDDIGTYGCGPTAMAMIISSFTDTKILPDAMASWAASSGYSAPGNGSYHAIVPDTCEKYGLSCVSIGTPTAEELSNTLSNGGVIVALMGPGHFTDSGHFIIIRGQAPSGDLFIADPNSLENTYSTWDPQTILNELSTATDSGSPMWLITTK